MNGSARAGHTGEMPVRQNPRAPAPQAEREDKRTQAERSETTTEELVAAARQLFAEKGFAGTSIDEIVRSAGVTKGALYHHFKNKEDLFEAVYCREQRLVEERVRVAAMKKRTAWGQLKAGCDEFLRASLDPHTQQICMVDGPAVRGPARMVEIDEPESVRLISMSLEKAMEGGELRKRPVMPLAQLLFGALCQGAMVAARSDDPVATTAQVRAELQRLLDGIQNG